MIKKSEIPADSLVGKFLPADYTDAFSCEVVTGKSLTADDVMVNIWTRQAGWVAALFRLRHFLVRFVGLQGDGEGDTGAFEKVIREGGSYRVASVAARNDHETVLLLSDRHLDAWMSIYVESDVTREETGKDVRNGDSGRDVRNGDRGRDARKTVFAITVVKFHNRLGRIYFAVIRPFHKIVVKRLLLKSVNGVK